MGRLELENGDEVNSDKMEPKFESELDQSHPRMMQPIPGGPKNFQKLQLIPMG